MIANLLNDKNACTFSLDIQMYGFVFINVQVQTLHRNKDPVRTENIVSQQKL